MSQGILWLLLPLFMMLLLGGCTASIASPIVSPLVIITLLITIPIVKKFKKLLPFLILGVIPTFMITSSFTLFAISHETINEVLTNEIVITVVLAALISGTGLGFITRIKNPYPFWLNVIKVLTEPIAIGFVFGYLVLGAVPWLLFLLIIVQIIPLAKQDILFVPMLFVFFYICGGFLMVSVPFGLTRILLDLYTFVTVSPIRTINHRTTNHINEAGFYNLSWIMTLLFLLSILSLIGWCCGFYGIYFIGPIISTIFSSKSPH